MTLESADGRAPKTPDSRSKLEMTQVKILSVTVTLFISTVSTIPLILFDKILAQSTGPWGR
ncbi:hypothetical protein J6590_034272 [Homalodisca vitripennis]|nr:hypothetical protein J6590_034272 [Homalodisca vitripennis]